MTTVDEVRRAPAGTRVALFATCANDVMFPQTPKAVVTLLERLGCEVVFPAGQTCCGQAFTNTGYFDEAVPVVVLAPSGPLFEKSLSNMEEVMARDGRILLLSDSAGLETAHGEAWASLELPSTNALTGPIVYAVPAQLLAYHCAIQKGTDVDQPRNLAKSVTVE